MATGGGRRGVSRCPRRSMNGRIDSTASPRSSRRREVPCSRRIFPLVILETSRRSSMSRFKVCGVGGRRYHMPSSDLDRWCPVLGKTVEESSLTAASGFLQLVGQHGEEFVLAAVRILEFGIRPASRAVMSRNAPTAPRGRPCSSSSGATYPQSLTEDPSVKTTSSSMFTSSSTPRIAETCMGGSPGE